MTRQDDGRYFFRKKLQVLRPGMEVTCVMENVALEEFFFFLERIKKSGFKIVLVGVDEDTVAVLVNKLRAVDSTRFDQVVSGYSYWRRILKKLDVTGSRKIGLEDYYERAIRKLHVSLTAKGVARVLYTSVRKLREVPGVVEDQEEDRKFVSLTCLRTDWLPIPMQRETPAEGTEEEIEVYSSFRPDSSLFIKVQKVDEICIDDSNNGEYVEEESHVKEESKDDDLIVICEDS
jgi:hypothetical protein